MNRHGVKLPVCDQRCDKQHSQMDPRVKPEDDDGGTKHV